MNSAIDRADTPLRVPSPDRIEAAGMTRFMRWAEARHGLSFDGYEAFHD